MNGSARIAWLLALFFAAVLTAFAAVLEHSSRDCPPERQCNGPLETHNPRCCP